MRIIALQAAATPIKVRFETIVCNRCAFVRRPWLSIFAAVVSISVFGVPAVRADEPAPAGAEQADKPMTPERRKDLEAARKRVSGILAASSFTEDETKKVYQPLLNFAMKEIDIRREISKLTNANAKKEYRKNFGKNVVDTRAAIVKAAGKKAGTKFDKYQKDVQAARDKAAKEKAAAAKKK